MIHIPPLVKEISTTHSAADIFASIKDEIHSVFLDSSCNDHPMATYSIIASKPFLTYSSKGDSATVTKMGESETFNNIDPLNLLKSLLMQYPQSSVKEKLPFHAGAIGYLGYDLAYTLENLPRMSSDVLNIPDIYFAFYDAAIIIENGSNKVYLTSTGHPESSPEDQLRRAKARLCELETIIHNTVEAPATPPPPQQQSDVHHSSTKNSYIKNVQRAIDYIFAGDIFQVNFTQQFQATLYEDPFDLYRRFRTINPAPYGSYLNFPDLIIASGSPERFLLVKDNKVETRPIKGTRPRTSDETSNTVARANLLASEKDRSELVMIVDLERNDLGKVCKFGSVLVPNLISLEEHPTVYHLVSTVTGTLSPEYTTLDLIRAAFPGGSISGAPKFRAMEIIDELEPSRRGLYTGSIGYIDFSGNADFNIAIRTFIIRNNQAYFNAGGGIVSDSIPSEEYQESLDKAYAMMLALGCKEKS